jgi:hypothetical protein
MDRYKFSCVFFVDQKSKMTATAGPKLSKAGFTKPGKVGEILTLYQLDYNCFVNRLYHKVQIICKKGVTCKKKQGDINLALESWADIG